MRSIMMGALGVAVMSLTGGLSSTAAAMPLDHLSIGSPLHRVGDVPRAAGISQLASTNWAGYADSGAASSFTKVTGQWVQPAATCSGKTSLAAFWTGIDGVSSADPTVEQDGTIVQCGGGTPTYYDWWETYPANTVQIEKPVSPGDHMTSTVTFSGGVYTMTVTDSTHTAASFSVTAGCGAATCENMSAEWIAEAPSSSAGKVYPLTDFGKWTLTRGSTTYLGQVEHISGPPTVDEITMVDGSNLVKAQPGSLNSTGGSFPVGWKRAS